VGVRGTDRQSLSRQADLLTQLFGNPGSQIIRHTKGIHGQNDHGILLARTNRQGLCKNCLSDTLRFQRSASKSIQADRKLRRDLDGCHTCQKHAGFLAEG
jgi:hypothetical protein